MQFERKSMYTSGMYNTPAGILAIYNTCRKLYNDQPNPLQVTAIKKYWRGGPDPLDYISMYANNGDSALKIPSHWHYVSYGLSDLHGDGRVHQCTGPEGISGFGFELTFRLKRERDETAPPTWPAALLQALARYVFQSENLLCVGDHIPWYTPLDGSESRIQHMLLADDAQLQPVQTPFGSVAFRQIIGVCHEELKAAQEWNGNGILELIKSLQLAGGPWLITDMRRGQTIFELNPQLQEQVDDGILQDGSNLSGVTSQCVWQEISERELMGEHSDDDADSNYNASMQLSSKQQLPAKSKNNDKPHGGLTSALSPITDGSDNQRLTAEKNAVRKTSFESTMCPELVNVHHFNGVHLRFSYDSGSLLLLALKSRLKHGRHFTFKSVYNDSAITLVPVSVVGAFVTEEQPFASQGLWLQVLISDSLLDEMIDDLNGTEPSSSSQVGLRKEYSWKDGHFRITISHDDQT